MSARGLILFSYAQSYLQLKGNPETIVYRGWEKQRLCEPKQNEVC